MSVLWYQQSVIYTAVLYSKILDELLPQTEATCTEMLAVANDFGIKTIDRVTHFIDNPEQVSVETIESITETFSMASDISSELVSELQNKSAEIIRLLLEQPMQTFESAYMELLSNLLNGYFQLVTNILTNI